MPTVEVAIGGRYARLDAGSVKRRSRKRRGGGKRGRVVTFSAAARKRLLDLVNKVAVDAYRSALFVTLTYPEMFPSPQKAKEHLDAFGKRLKRRWPRAAFVWRLEFQRRGAPHFHLIVFGIPFMPPGWLARAWYEVVGSGDPRHAAAGTEVRRVRNFRRAVAYAAKYLAKTGDRGGDGGVSAIEGLGRIWGVVGRGCLPIRTVRVVLSWRQFWELKRDLRRFVERRLSWRVWAWRKRWWGMTAYVSEGCVWSFLLGRRGDLCDVVGSRRFFVSL